MEENSSKVKILIVEDEGILAEDIKYRLITMGYEVVGIAATVIIALEKITKNPAIDILLIDIGIEGDSDGIDLATIIKTNYEIPFIFLTSNTDNHTIERAKKTNPYAYILKPINDKQISVAIELALVNFQNKRMEQQLISKKEKETLLMQDCLFLKKKNHFERVFLKDILFFQADSNYCNIYTTSDKYTYSTVLKKIEEQLPKKQFLRVHRSYVVNINKIKGFEGNILFIEDEKIPVSKPHKEEVFKLFNTL
ncbi:LytR/AlgR family response regulator transcription factor [Kordia sp.]|uniref:LytR/AlgR family response regulator transcription factor n=1 Tax=Kordia sp. TaxID=1965332 RepID=UPI003D6ABD1A